MRAMEMNLDTYFELEMNDLNRTLSELETETFDQDMSDKGMGKDIEDIIHEYDDDYSFEDGSPNLEESDLERLMYVDDFKSYK